MKKIVFLFILVLTISGCASSVDQSDTTYILTAQENYRSFVPNTVTQTYEFNKQNPGPTLYATVGSEFSVLAKNNINEPITIHWHGMQLPNDMDGVPRVTQDAILPGNSFTYRFTPQNSGVYWYHSHVDAHKQVEMGLQGTLIVKDEKSHIESDSDTVLVLDDIALNDLGEYASFDLNYMHGRLGNIILVNGKIQPSIYLGGAHHRFRLVNTANARSFYVNFDNIPITVVGEDIGFVQNYTVKQLEIHPGERFDVIVSSNESFALNYQTSQSFYKMALLNVSEKSFNSEKLISQEPIIEINLPKEALTMKPTLEMELQGVRDPVHGLVWNIKGTNSLTNPQTFHFDQGELVKIRLINTQGQSHPMHLHGQKFKIISRNGITQEKDVWKDTVMVKNREVIDIAFIAEGEGEWVFHCHILEHAKAGMLTSITIT